MRSNVTGFSLPKNWPQSVKTAVLHVVSLAHVAIVHARSIVVNGPDAGTRHTGDLQGALDEIALLDEELRIKDTRMTATDAHRRPHYRPIERMAILELKAARGWSQAETARRFLVKSTTIASWLKRVDESSPAPLVQMREPVNKFPDLVRYLIRRLKVLFPSMGRKRIAQTLARAGLRLSASTVGRMLKARGRDPERPTETEATVPTDTGGAQRPTDGRTVTAKRPNHVWHVDLTVVPTTAGFWAPWFPLSLPQVWPFCWWVACSVDHYSRLVLGFAVFKKQPSSAAVRAFLGRAIGKAEASPKYIICDQGPQFTSAGFKAWCRRKNIHPRYGAAHRYGSIAVIERFIKSLKDEWLRRLVIPLRLEAMRKELSVYSSWFNEHRPHQAFAGCTPREIYEGAVPLNQARCSDLRPARRAQNHTVPGRLRLAVTYHEGRRHLPIIELKRVA
jgi:transposase InsO family protein